MESSLPGITRGQDELRSFRFPAPTAVPVRFIAAPVPDGIRIMGVMGRSTLGCVHVGDQSYLELSNALDFSLSLSL
jgi:hypothetical protein